MEKKFWGVVVNLFTDGELDTSEPAIVIKASSLQEAIDYINKNNDSIAILENCPDNWNIEDDQAKAVFDSGYGITVEFVVGYVHLHHS